MSYIVEKKKKKKLAFFCILECTFLSVQFFLKLQLNVTDFLFYIHLLRDLFSLRKSKLFALEIIVRLEMLGPIISFNQSTSMVNDCFPISSL